MKYYPIIIATIFLACTTKETPRNEKVELDSLGQHYWDRELRTARAATYNGGKFPLPETL